MRSRLLLSPIAGPGTAILLVICDHEDVPATVWKGRLSFGMVSVPVRLYKAARRERIKFHHVYRPLNEPAEPEADSEDQAPPPAMPGRPASNVIRQFPGILDEPTPADEVEPVARVRHTPLTESLQEQVPAQSILKGYETEKD